MTVLIKVILLINIVAFLTMGYDKFQARRHRWRIPESTLLAMAALMGAAGILAGMYLLRHKTKHTLFKYGVPLLFSFNILVIYYLANTRW